MCVICLGLQTCKVRHLDVCLYGFKKDMSERVHLNVLYFLSFIALYTNWVTWQLRRILRGRESTHLVSYFPLHAHG